MTRNTHKYAVMAAVASGLLLSACGNGKTETPTAPKIDTSQIKPAQNTMNILPANMTMGAALINPPRAKDGFGALNVQTIGTYNGLYTLLQKNGLTLGNVMRVRVSLAPDASGKVDYDAYMAEYKKFFGTEKIPSEPIHVITGVRSLPTPGQLILIEADIAIPAKPKTQKAE